MEETWEEVLDMVEEGRELEVREWGVGVEDEPEEEPEEEEEEEVLPRVEEGMELEALEARERVDVVDMVR